MVTIKELKKELKKKTDVDPDNYYPTAVLKEKGFLRQQCKHCGMMFWSLNASDFCGEPECGSEYSFIGKPLGKKMTFTQTWDSFAAFFKVRGYTPIKRYPVAARWRDDTDFVQASIYDFQPHVVSGNVKPPANPLVVPQYCLRFNDIENVGITGRHKTGFVMIGQHAFMSPEDFDQPKYFRDLFEWFTDEVRIPAKELKVHENQWGGGGNLGVCLEFFAGGLELGNQVYMLYKTTDDGYEPLNLKVLDMGLGQSRVSWLVNGTTTMYDAEFPGVCQKMFEKIGVFPSETFKQFMLHASTLDINAGDPAEMEAIWKSISEKMNVEVGQLKESVLPMAAIYSIADHCQSLLFALSDGVLPSNVGGGYNLRAILRRSLSFIDRYGWNISLNEVCKWHAEEWNAQYPELVEGLDEVYKILDYEKRKYDESSEKARRKVSAVISGTNNIDFDTLFRMYDSDGITPELIKDVASKEGIEVNVPNDFYMKVSAMHDTKVAEKTKEEFNVDGIPKTERLYYEKVLEFKSYVLRDWTEGERHYIVMDRTAFYPESGGQDYDTGMIDILHVLNVQKYRDVIVHEVEGAKNFVKGTMVNCKVDAKRRKQLMMHHTATHIINGAARRVLGNHVWQAGAEKKEDKARLDITHYETPSDEQMAKIEALANEVIREDRPVTKEVFSRSDAEQKYGFRLYQGGAIPSNDIRVVDIKDWDIEACGGTHADSTGEVEEIKLLKPKRIQDGIIRLEFVAGHRLAGEAVKKLESDEQNTKGILVRKILDISASEKTDGKSYEELEEMFKNLLRDSKKKAKETAQVLDLSEDIVYLENADMKAVQEAARKKVKENPEAFAVVISNGAVYGIRGEECLMDVERFVKAAAEVLGGKYGIRNSEFTGGGPQRQKSREAYERAKALLG